MDNPNKIAELNIYWESRLGHSLISRRDLRRFAYPVSIEMLSVILLKKIDERIK